LPKVCGVKAEKGATLAEIAKATDWQGGWFKKINLLTNTTPALRATPPRLEEGSSALVPTLCAK